MASQIHIQGYLVDDRGTWTVRARLADFKNGKQKLHSKSTGLKVAGNNKRRAEAKMREIVKAWEQQAGAGHISDSGLLFGECVKIWLQHKALTVRENTLASYRIMVRVHIIPALGDIPLGELTRQHIQSYFDSLKDTVSASTMRKHRVVIHGVLEDACLDDLISVNVCDRVRLPKRKRFEGKALDETEVARLLAETEKQKEPMRCIITLALAYGLRRSELCGLRWCDVDFANGVIHIRNTRTEYSGLVYEAEATKTKASRRDLVLVGSTVTYLQELLEKQKKSGKYNGLVCVHEDGREVKPEYVTRSAMKFLKACGFDGVRLHDVRHTAASILARRVPIKQVQAFLGHEDVHTTLAIYTHILNGDSRETSNAMSGFLESLSDCSENCSEIHRQGADNVIDIAAFRREKLEKRPETG